MKGDTALCGNVLNSCGLLFSGFFRSISTKLSKTTSTWKKRLTDKDECLNYCSAEWQKLVFIVLYYVIMILLFAEAVFRMLSYIYLMASFPPALTPNVPPTKGYAYFYGANTWVCIARGFGQLLNFNCALVVLPVMRTILTIFRTLKFGIVAPLDKNIIFHRYIAYNIAIFGLLHGLAHYMNYACCYTAYVDPSYSTTSVIYSPFHACWGTKYGITGNMLILVMVFMYAAASATYRRSNNFTIFWFAHHLFIIFFVLLLVHGQNFWMWFFGPGAAYILERILRNIRGSSPTIVKRVHLLPSKVVKLELSKPSFNYKAGQYCFVNCPVISKHEWHPFTISSSPSEEFLTFHIRCVGDWTNALAEFFIPSRKVQTIEFDKDKTPDGRDHLIRIDGPFGTCADFVWSFDYVMLVAAGIGVTPYSSLLKDIHHKLHSENNLRIKKVFFYWINRDEGSWEWFSELLNRIESQDPDFFDLNTFMTGGMSEEQIKQIVFSSTEYLEKSSTGDKQQADNNVQLLARVLYPYEPQGTDELRLEEKDVVVVEERDPSGWWKGKNTNTGLSGLFPNNFVVLIDSVTKMQQSKNRKFGRPVWKDEFSRVRDFVNSTTTDESKKKVGVFFCGPAGLSKSLYTTALSQSKKGGVKFVYHKENF